MVDETVLCQGFVPICHSTHEYEFTAVIPEYEQKTIILRNENWSEL